MDLFTLTRGSGVMLGMNFMIVLAWLIFSFLLWRGLRHFAVEEDRIFDLTFYATLVGFIAARFGFIITHSDLFLGKSFLLTIALWVTPGLSWLSGLVGAVSALVLLSRRYKVRLGLVLDTLAVALPLPIILGLAGSLLGGAVIGKPMSLRIAVLTGESLNTLHHPVQFYEMIALVALGLIILRMSSRATRDKWPYGLVGVWFFLLYAAFSFVLELFKDSRVYWGGLNANQWILIGIFAECVGVLYVRGGGREMTRPLLHKLMKFFEEKGKRIHESISKRHTR